MFFSQVAVLEPRGCRTPKLAHAPLSTCASLGLSRRCPFEPRRGRQYDFDSEDCEVCAAPAFDFMTQLTVFFGSHTNVVYRWRQGTTGFGHRGVLIRSPGI